ncbi:hypothetical protein DMA11_02255 [Marinilabiliaceae bacterium JC017]|nr:hypothetical protein DMA11_02255 [Marinilabiliaceae bacterium JC017]
MKKVWLILLVLVSLITLFLSIHLIKKHKHYDNNDAIKGIPTSTSAILRIPNLNALNKEILDQIHFKNELNDFHFSSYAINWLSRIDTLPFFNDPTLDILKDRNLFLSFHPAGKSKVETLILTEFTSKAEENNLINYIKSKSGTSFNISQRKYNASTIYIIKANNHSAPFYFSLNQGILTGSFSNILLESSIRQFQSETNLLSSGDFQKIYKTIGKSPSANLLLNFSNLPKLLKPALEKHYKEQAAFLDKQSKWAEYDIDIKNDAILLNGILTPASGGLLSELFIGMKPQKPQLNEVIPTSSRMFLTYCVESASALQKRFHQLLDKNNALITYQSKITQIEKQAQINPDKLLFSMMDNEMALVFFDRNETKIKENAVLVIKTKSKSQTSQKMLSALKNISNTQQIKPVDEYRLDEHTAFPIYKNLPENTLSTTLEWFFPVVPQKYFAVYDNYLLLANSTRPLKSFIYANILHKTIKHENNYKDFHKQFPMRENLFFYSEIPYIPTFLKGITRNHFSNLSSNQNEALSHFYGLGIQIAGTENMLYSTIYANYSPNRESEPRTTWQSLLDTFAITKPALVRNHYTNEKEVLIQDANFNLYLINNKGRILWKKPLDGPILSDFTQIDFYKNKKLQCIFNTKSKIYLLDRNGNSVDNYPIKLPTQATNALYVADYDKNRNYRIFIACNNNKVYLFDKKGNRLTGWTFNKTEGKVTQPIKHFRSAGKDYIVFSDDKRIYIQNRRGESRVIPSESFIQNPNSVFYLEEKGTNARFLITSTIDGKLAKVSLPDGKTTFTNLDIDDSSHGFSYFCSNKTPYYVVILPNELKILSVNGKKLVQKQFKDKIQLHADVYKFSSNNYKIGLLSKKQDQIFLINTNGKDYKGFPLKGETRFSIGLLKSSANKFNLIVGGGDNYLYNYKVD